MRSGLRYSVMILWLAAMGGACDADPEAIMGSGSDSWPGLGDPGGGLESPELGQDATGDPSDPGSGDDGGAIDGAGETDDGGGGTVDSAGEADTGADATLPDGVGGDDGGEIGPADTADTGGDTDGDGGASGAIARRSCIHTFRFEPGAGESVDSASVPGTFNSWSTDALPMTQVGGGAWESTLDMSALPPGGQGYKLLINGTDWRLDEANRMRRFDDAVLNSKLIVPDCRAPLLVLRESQLDPKAGTARVVVGVEAGIGGELDMASPRVAHNFEPIDGAWHASTGELLVELSDLPAGKHSFRFDASGPEGAAEPLIVSFWVAGEPFDWRDATLYFAFTDRFRDGDPTTGQPSDCLPADSPSNWKGGDWKGITEAIEEGYFDTLGINTLWLSAPNDNPDACDVGLEDYVYTSYHGYHPAHFYQPEEHFGSLEDLRALVLAAHARGIRVLVDLVANHVYEDAPEWLEHQDDGWFNLPVYVCGWDEPETCWFRSYLPDLNYRNDEVVEHVSEIALWWIEQADLDGFRIDAVKHMHRNFLFTLREKIERRIEARADSLFYTVGETFTGKLGDDAGEIEGVSYKSEELIRSYVDGDQLYGQFDFPVYWAIVETLARGEAPLTTLASVLTTSRAFYGDRLMAAFLGNHDVSRFVSHANGDIGDLWGNGTTAQGWEDPPAQPSGDEPYARLALAFTTLAALPYLPLVYYGDEVGLAGAGDPDNRRMMPWSGLSDAQKGVRAHVSAVLGARRRSEALRRGDLQVVDSGADTLAISRTAPSGEQAFAVINRGSGEFQATLPTASAGGEYIDALDESSWQASGGSLTVSVPARSSRLLLPAAVAALP